MQKYRIHVALLHDGRIGIESMMALAMTQS